VIDHSPLSSLRSRMLLYAHNIASYALTLGQASRSENPYATHIPILIALSRFMRIRRILEFGSGTMSTSIFLNQEVFPLVEQVVSYEHDKEWYNIVKSQAIDSRLSLRLVDNDIYKNVKDIKIDDYDLIFVDDSTSASLRSKTISELTSRRSEISGVVVIHDFEQTSYRKASRSFKHKKRFRALNPEVGLLWELSSLKLNNLGKIDPMIKKHSGNVAHDDITTWLRLMDENSI